MAVINRSLILHISHNPSAVDRFEGNTKGKVAVFGLLETAGVPLDNNVGNTILVWMQKFNRFLNGTGQVYSKPEKCTELVEFAVISKTSFCLFSNHLQSAT